MTRRVAGGWPGALLAALAACALVLGGRGPARAQAPGLPPGVTVTTTFEPEEPRVGDRVQLTIEVQHPADRLVTMSAGLTRRAELEVITTEPPTTLPSGPSGDRLLTRFAFVLQPFVLGAVEVGTVTLQVLAEDGSAQEFGLALDPLGIRTTLDPARAALRPLKPQAEIAGAPPAWQRPALVGALVASVASLLLGGALLLRRRARGDQALLPPLPPATAEDEARALLDNLRARALLAIPDLEGYYGRLSIAVRSYLQERFDFRATALTTHELERRMAAQGLDRWQARLVTGLLERCDAAVYARVYPPLASADHDLTVAYEIVELARPRREAEAVPA